MMKAASMSSKIAIVIRAFHFGFIPASFNPRP